MSSGTGAGGNTSSAYGSGGVSHGAASTGRSLEVETDAEPDHNENEEENLVQDKSSTHPSVTETLQDHNQGERSSFEPSASHGSDGGHGIEHDGDGGAHDDDNGTEGDRDQDLSLAVVQDAPEDSSSSTHSISGRLGLNSDSENEGATRGNGSNSRDSSRNRGANRGGGDRVGDAEVGFHDIDAALPDNSEAGGIGIYVRLDSTENFSDREYLLPLILTSGISELI